MISIILLIFLVRSIGKAAREMNESPTKWKVRAILAWILGDLCGELLIYNFFGLNLVLLAIFGPGIGYLGYLMVRQWLDNLEE
jgi:hypothetical protein